MILWRKNRKINEWFKIIQVLTVITMLSLSLCPVYAQNEFYLPNYTADYTIIASNQIPTIKFYQPVFSVISQLTTSEPAVALRSQAYRDIIGMGADAVPALKDIAADLTINTDVRKWALRLLGETANKYQMYEVKDFLTGVINDSSGRYEWWHKTEARNGLNRLYERFSKLKPKEDVEIKGSSSVNTKTAKYLKQLTTSEPAIALNSHAYQQIILIGSDAVSTLKEIATNLTTNTDTRKWALRLLGETANEKQASEVKNFLEGVINDSSGRYEWWHKTEAQNGLDRLYERFSKLKPINPKIKTEGVSQYSEVMSQAIKLTTSEPAVALRSQAYRDIIGMGADAVPALKDIAADLTINTDVRKWALRLLGETANKYQMYEVKDFLTGVINDSSGRYEWWHKTEARNGLNRLYERFPKLKLLSQEIESKKNTITTSYLDKSFKLDSGMRDFLPTKQIN